MAAIESVWWDLDDEPGGNVQHIAEHGLTKEEVEAVLSDPPESDGPEPFKRPATFGWTSTGKHIIVIWEEVQDDPRTAYPVTAYEVPPRFYNTESIMVIKRVQKKIDWSAEDRARHQAIRETYKDKPTLEELIARGELSGHPITLGAYVNLRSLVANLRALREQAQLSLADVSERSGMDKAMLSRLENGHVPNPGIETISRYLDALGKVLEWRVVEASEGQVSV